MEYILNAMKFSNQSKSSSLVISIIFEIEDLDPKFNCSVPDFYEYWHLQQIKHVNY